MFDNAENYVKELYDTLHAIPEKGMEEYTVAAVLKTDIRKFPFTKTDFPDESGLKEYVDLAKSQEVFETGENVEECNSMLTLVTCAYEWSGARTVVIAVR